MNARDELALELFIGDNSKQPREASVADWEYYHAEGRFLCRVEHYEVMADAILAVGYVKPRVITTVEELDAAIVRSFEQGENLVLLSVWRPWIVWEDDRGNLHVSSLPVEGDPERLTLSDIILPATVLHEAAK